jgi:hypothetical protein
MLYLDKMKVTLKLFLKKQNGGTVDWFHDLGRSPVRGVFYQPVFENIFVQKLLHYCDMRLSNYGSDKMPDKTLLKLELKTVVTKSSFFQPW